MDVRSPGADSGSWHCLSIARETPIALGPDLRSTPDRGYRNSDHWLSEDALPPAADAQDATRPQRIGIAPPGDASCGNRPIPTLADRLSMAL